VIDGLKDAEQTISGGGKITLDNYDIVKENNNYSSMR
jgi:hypothetical protein